MISHGYKMGPFKKKYSEPSQNQASALESTATKLCSLVTGLYEIVSIITSIIKLSREQVTTA